MGHMKNVNDNDCWYVFIARLKENQTQVAPSATLDNPTPHQNFSPSMAPPLWKSIYATDFEFLNLLETIHRPCTDVSCCCGDWDDTMFLNIVSLFWTLCLTHLFKVYNIRAVFIKFNMTVSYIYYLDVDFYSEIFYRVKQSWQRIL